MADVEWVIKIPEEVRVAIARMGLLRIPNEMQKKVDRAIQRGTPLPKGHGRLGDLDEARTAIEGFQNIIRSGTPDARKAAELVLLGRCKKVIGDIDTIIEADKKQ